MRVRSSPDSRKLVVCQSSKKRKRTKESDGFDSVKKALDAAGHRSERARTGSYALQSHQKCTDLQKIPKYDFSNIAFESGF